MSILTLATLLASFARQSTAITRPKTTPQVGPKLWATRNTGATFLVAAVYLAALTPIVTSKTAFEPADAFGLAMVALAGTTVRFVLADPEALGFKNIQPVAVAAFPAALAVAALA